MVTGKDASGEWNTVPLATAQRVPNDSRDLRIPPSIRGGSRRREGRIKEQFDDEAITVARFLSGKAAGETVASVMAEVANEHVGAAARIRAAGVSDREWLALWKEFVLRGNRVFLRMRGLICKTSSNREEIGHPRGRRKFGRARGGARRTRAPLQGRVRAAFVALPQRLRDQRGGSYALRQPIPSRPFWSS